MVVSDCDESGAQLPAVGAAARRAAVGERAGCGRRRSRGGEPQWTERPVAAGAGGGAGAGRAEGAAARAHRGAAGGEAGGVSPGTRRGDGTSRGGGGAGHPGGDGEIAPALCAEAVGARVEGDRGRMAGTLTVPNPLAPWHRAA